MSNLNLKAVLDLVDRVSAPLRKISKSLDHNSDAILRNLQNFNRLKQQYGSFHAIREVSRDLEIFQQILARPDVQAANQHLRQTYQTLNKVSVELKENRHDLDLVKSSLIGVSKLYLGLGNTLDVVANKSDRLSQSLAKSRQAMRADAMKTGIGVLTAGYGFKRLIQSGIDFEKQMSAVQAVLDLDKASADFKNLQADARKFGASSSFSAPQVAEAQFNLGSGGFNAQQIRQSIGGTLDLASAGMLEIATAAEIAVGTLNGFGLQADQIGRLNDVMLKTTNLTATSVYDLGETMKYAAPIAKQYGVSLEQANAMTGLLGNANIKGSEAGTALRAIMARLAAPPKEAMKVLDKLGVKTTDSKGNMRDIADVIGDIQKAASKLGDAGRIDAFKDIAGLEAVSAFAILADHTNSIDANTGQTVNNIKKMTLELENSNGAAKRAADILKDNMAGDIEQLKGAWEELGISLKNVLDSDLRGFIKTITDVVNGISTWVAANPELVRQIGKILLYLLAFKVGILGVKYSFNLVFGTFFSMIAAITKFALVMYVVNRVAGHFGFGFGSRLALMAKGVRLFGAAFIFLAKHSIPMVIQGLIGLSIALFTTPIGWMILAIGAAALLIIKYWQPIKAFFQGLWAGLVEGLAPLRATFGTVFDSMRESLAPLQPLWEVLGNALGFVIDLIKQLFTPFQATSGELANATTYGHAFGLMLADVIHVVGTLVAMLLHFAGFVIGLVIQGWQQIGASAAAMWVSITEFFNSGIGNITAAIINFSPLQLFYSAFASVLSWFGIELPGKFSEFGAMLMNGLANGITGAVSGVLERVKSAGTWMIDTAKGVLGIHSPSRVFAQLGGYTMQGLEQGLLSSAAMPINAIGRTSQDMIKALDTSQIQIDRRPPLTAAAVGGRTGGQATAGAPITIHVHPAAGMNEQQLAQLVAAEVAKATRPTSNRGALYDID